jgi:ligand-binding SRPBCC domain-containing protein
MIESTMSSETTPGFTLEREQLVRRSLEEVFRFFSDPANLEAITPPWLNFRVLACSTPVLGEGTTIDYKLRVHGLPLRWRSLIRSWDPPFRFVDEQLRGPYRSWVHQHSFRATDEGVVMGDRVDYGVLGGALIHGLFVRRDLARIFDYRRECLERLFPNAQGQGFLRKPNPGGRSRRSVE